MSFNFNPAAGETESSSAVDLRRQLAAAMMQQGMQSTPIQSPWQGVARLSEALMGGLAARRQAQQEQAANSQLMAAMTGQPYTPPAQSSGFLSKLFGDNGVPASGAQAQVDAGSPAPQPTGTSQPADISGDRQKFVDTLMPTAMEVSKQTGVDPRIIVAQAAQESGWGAHAPGNNLFGIKSHGQPGGNTLATTEYVNGAPVQTTASFRGYESPADSVRGYGDFIMKNPRYGDLRQAQGIDAQLTALGASGYATDPRYAQHVGAIARGIQIPNEVASLDPSVGMGAAAPIQQPNTQPTMPPPSPTAQPTDMATVSPDQMQAMLGPQPTPGYRDPMVTTAFRQDPAPAPSAQAIQQQAPSPVPQQSAAISPDVSTPRSAETGGAGLSVAPSPVAATSTPVAPQQGSTARLAAALQSQPPQAPNPLMTNPRAKALALAMMNPNASPQVRQMAGTMLQQEMSRGQALYQAQMEQYIKQQDPAYQATLAKAQYEAAHLGEISPDTKATLAAQEQKMKFDAQQQLTLADHNQQLKQSDPLQQANLAKTNAEAANVGVTNDIHDYEYYRNNEVKAGRTPLGPLQYQQELKKAGATTINTGDNSSKFQIKADEEAATRMGGYVSDGNGASQMLGDVQQLADLGPMIGTGKTAQFKAALGPYAQALGINVEGLGETQAYQSIIDRLAPSMRPAGSGSSSDTDVKMFLNSLPSIGNQPGGNQIITSTLASVQQHKMAAAEIAAKSFLPAGQGGLSWQEAEKQIRQLPNPYQGFNDYRKKLSDGGQNPLPSDQMNVPTDIPGVTIRRISK